MAIREDFFKVPDQTLKLNTRIKTPSGLELMLTDGDKNTPGVRPSFIADDKYDIGRRSLVLGDFSTLNLYFPKPAKKIVLGYIGERDFTCEDAKLSGLRFEDLNAENQYFAFHFFDKEQREELCKIPFNMTVHNFYEFNSFPVHYMTIYATDIGSVHFERVEWE